MIPIPSEVGHIDFGADPVGDDVGVGVGIGIGVGMTLPCLHNILWTSGWILTKFSRTYNWDITKKWLDFDDLDLLYKATAVEELKIYGWGTSIFSENTNIYWFFFFNFSMETCIPYINASQRGASS